MQATAAHGKTLASDISFFHVPPELAVLLVYPLSPLDSVPDFLPVIDYADDVIVLAVTILSVIRSAGPAQLRRHGLECPTKLAVVERRAGLPTAILD